MCRGMRGTLPVGAGATRRRHTLRGEAARSAHREAAGTGAAASTRSSSAVRVPNTTSRRSSGQWSRRTRPPPAQQCQEGRPSGEAEHSCFACVTVDYDVARHIVLACVVRTHRSSRNANKVSDACTAEEALSRVPCCPEATKTAARGSPCSHPSP